MKVKKLLTAFLLLFATAGLITTTSCKDNTDTHQEETEKYTVTFDSAGGSAVTSQSVLKNNKITKPTDPTKDGYVFGGWYKEADCKNSWNFNTDTVTGAVTLYAKWTEEVKTKKFTVTFDSDGGSTVASLSIEKNGKVTKPTDPTKEGYTFDGWFNGSTEYNFNDPVTEPLTLKAHWTKIEVAFTATLKYDNGADDGKLTAAKTEDKWFFTKPTDPVKDDHTFDAWYTEAGDLFDFTKPVTANVVLVAHYTPVEHGPKATLVYNNGEADGELLAVKVGEAWFFEKPTDPHKDYFTFAGWYTDVELKTPFNFDNEVDSDMPLYAKWNTAYDTITTTWDFVKGATAIKENPSGNVTLTADTLFQGKFLLGANARFEIGSKNAINTQKKTLEVTLSGTGTSNAMTFNGKWSSSNDGYFKFINKKTGEVVYDSGTLKNNAEFSTSITNLPAGTYAIESNGSVRFYAFSITEELPQSPVSDITLNTSALATNVLLGRPFDKTGLTVSLSYENGREDLLDLDKVSIIVPTDFTTTAGVKTITVEYQADSTHKYTKTFNINVCETEEIVLYDYVMDSKRLAKPLQVIYERNAEKLDTSNLVVKARCLAPGSTTEYIEFILDAKEYTISNVDFNTLGSKTVTVTYAEEFTKSYDIEVVNYSTIQDRPMTVSVDPTLEVVSFSFEQEYNFHTINQALQFIRLLEPYDTCVKTIVLKEGAVYNEKVVIDIPNVILTTNTERTYTGDWSYDNEEVQNVWAGYATIEYDSFNGLLDPSETITHSTNGSATVTITPEAVNFKASKVNFKHSCNTSELYQEILKKTNGTQGVALLVQGDRASFTDCTFTGYQDTLYAQVGRQYYKNCLIEGHTDYIFGYNATALFDECIIRQIGAGKTAAENSNYNNGGYIVSTKGFSKNDETDGIEYGYVFTNSQFIADDKTADGSVSIARSWDSNMRIMVMNSYLDKHISKEAFGEVTAGGSKNMNDRYGEMNSNTLKPAFLLEYNNTGAGAISENLTNTCTYADSSTASKYLDVNVIFTPFNRNLTYDLPWNPTKEADAYILFKDQNGDNVGIIGGDRTPNKSIAWVGGVVTEKALNSVKAYLEAIMNGPKTILGFYQDQACTTPVDYKNMILTEGVGVEHCQNIIYAKIVDGIVKQTETFNANTTNYTASTGTDGKPAGTSLRDNQYTGTSFTVVAGGSGDTKAATLGMTATANDDSGLTFNTAFVPGGSGRTYTITATQKITIKIYYTVSNGDICTATSAFTKVGELTYDGTIVTSVGNKSNNVAYCCELELNAGQSFVLGTDSSDRLILFGIVAEY
ncbi:MAG: pectinesterase family protein [Roseburia sp.]|nr:pectinesterase family protein [Anaeroplasma bactoclasticum]MCM1195762.1 pectinesterase family protein [Roseburia sp.]